MKAQIAGLEIKVAESDAATACRTNRLKRTIKPIGRHFPSVVDSAEEINTASPDAERFEHHGTAL
jgi:hypothetical protein